MPRLIYKDSSALKDGMATTTTIPVILCGGSGTRLWPLSREQRPKQFLSLVGEESLLRQTLRRAVTLTGCLPAEVVTVTLRGFADAVRDEMESTLSGAASHVIAEPVARNTAAAVIYAALLVKKQYGADRPVWVIPSDHFIGRQAILGEALEQAVQAAQQGNLVTFGIQPTRPDTGYGYIRFTPGSGGAVVPAQGFFEKPDLDTARSYLESGKFLWNSGMFVFTPAGVLQEATRLVPELLAAVEVAQTSGKNPLTPGEEAYRRIPEISFDKAIMEKSERVMVVPCDPAWSDIGSWQSLWDISPRDESGNAVFGEVCLSGTKNCYLRSEGRVIACAGVENLVVVDTGDVVMVADRRNPDSLRALVARLREAGRRDLLERILGNNS